MVPYITYAPMHVCTYARMDVKNNLSLHDLDYCVIDTETTGGSPLQDHIIEVAVIHWRDGIIYDRFNTLINPGVPIPDWITDLTGINDEMVKNAPAFSDIARPLKAFLSQGVFTAHNAPFDYGFVRGEFVRLGEQFESPALCTLQLARRLFPDLRSRSLGSLCEHLLINIYDRHRAFGDAEATVYVLKNILKMLKADRRVENWAELEAFLNVGNLILPEGMTYAVVDSLPTTPGTYILKDINGVNVFQGQAKNIRQRVQSHFARTNQSLRSKKLRNSVKSIEVRMGSSLPIRQKISKVES